MTQAKIVHWICLNFLSWSSPSSYYTINLLNVNIPDNGSFETFSRSYVCVCSMFLTCSLSGAVNLIKMSINDIEARIRELENAESHSRRPSSLSSDGTEGLSDAETGSFSGYSCDSSDTDYSEDSVEPEDARESPDLRRKDEFANKASYVARKKIRLGTSDVCFRFVVGNCQLNDCIFRHCKLESLNEEERGDLVRELRRKPFDPTIGVLVKQLNIPMCKTFSKEGQCRFVKCRFWHIESENDALWAGLPYWCAPCRKAFTSDSQLREHSNGKFHRSNISRIA